MRGLWGIDPGWGLTAVRVVMAIIFIVAGYQKWFVFGVLGGVTANFARYGLPFPAAFAVVAGLLELGGGILLLIGLWTRWLGLLYAVEFVIATFWVKLRLASFADARVDLMILAGAILLFLAGPGKASVDEVWLEKPTA